MPQDIEWRQIVRLLDRILREGRAAPGLLDSIEYWERGARERVTKALVDGMGARRRYDTDPEFHRAIDAIAQIATFAVFDEPLVTDDERQARREGFDLAFFKLPEPPPRPLDASAYRAFYLDQFDLPSDR